MFIPVGDTSSRVFPTRENDGPISRPGTEIAMAAPSGAPARTSVTWRWVGATWQWEKLFGATNGEDMYH